MDEHVGVEEGTHLRKRGRGKMLSERLLVCTAVLLPPRDVGDKHARADHVRPLSRQRLPDGSPGTGKSAHTRPPTAYTPPSSAGRVPLALTFNLSQVAGGACGVLAGALIDVWQCDGVATFTTIYPGWYGGRAVHVHFKVCTDVAGQPYEFTSQLYFDEALTDRVHALAPYVGRERRDTTQASDGILSNGGESLMVRASETAAGYAAAFDLGLDLADAVVGRPDGFGGSGWGFGRITGTSPAFLPFSTGLGGTRSMADASPSGRPTRTIPHDAATWTLGTLRGVYGASCSSLVSPAGGSPQSVSFV